MRIQIDLAPYIDEEQLPLTREAIQLYTNEFAHRLQAAVKKSFPAADVAVFPAYEESDDKLTISNLPADLDEDDIDYEVADLHSAVYEEMSDSFDFDKYKLTFEVYSEMYDEDPSGEWKSMDAVGEHYYDLGEAQRAMDAEARRNVAGHKGWTIEGSGESGRVVTYDDQGRVRYEDTLWVYEGASEDPEPLYED